MARCCLLLLVVRETLGPVVVYVVVYVVLNTSAVSSNV